MPVPERVFAATFRPREPAGAAMIWRKTFMVFAAEQRAACEKKCGLLFSPPQISRDERQMNGRCRKLFGRIS
jgi:hypothetical protein